MTFIETNPAHAEQAAHMFNWAMSDATSYNSLQKLATLGNYLGTIDRFQSATKLATYVCNKMRRANDWVSTYDETGMAVAVKLFLDYRPEK